jgi:WhiB family redox-sensing transcriptional regulator
VDTTVPRRDWRDRARCADIDPEVFFPEIGEPTDPGKRVCTSCQVKAECLAHALEHHERFGIWGGLSEQERRLLARAAGRR